MGKSTLAPGFRFHPTDEELIMYYLKRKILGKKLSVNPIAELDVYKYAPWDLPNMSCWKTGDLKWHFYCPIVKKYGRGDRVNRATVYGYWKTTGKDRAVKYRGDVVGMIKTLVFHQGKAPRGDRTDWVMHEYRLEGKELADRGIIHDSYMLYAVFKKDGMGPKNGAQYGAPFNEEEWSDDDDGDKANLPGTSSLCGTSTEAVVSPSCVPESLCAGPTDADAFSHPESLCAEPTDAEAYSVPESLCAEPADAGVATCMDTSEGPMVTVADSVPASSETPQPTLVLQCQEPNDNNLESIMLDVFTEDHGQMICDFTDSFIEAPKVCEEDDILSILAAFTEVDNAINWCL